MKYSFIFCYRDREAHLAITIPRIHDLMFVRGQDYEIILVEQADKKPFRRGNLFNTGAQAATGDILIFHDIDHYPHQVDYWPEQAGDVFLPIKYVQYKMNDLSERPDDDVPGGYRHFKNGVDDDYFGGVICFTRDAFFKINGFSPMFIGWGFEDADLRERVQHHRLKVSRSESNMFYALHHPDSGGPAENSRIQRNIQIWMQWRNQLTQGVTNQVQRIVSNMATDWVNQWIKVTDYYVDPGSEQIQSSPFLLDEILD
jgi:beta-1,4-galactosyltransferase 4